MTATETKTKPKRLASLITIDDVPADMVIDLAVKAAKPVKAKAPSIYQQMIDKVRAGSRAVQVRVPEGFTPKQVLSSVRAAIKKAKAGDVMEAKASTFETYVWLLRLTPPPVAAQ